MTKNTKQFNNTNVFFLPWRICDIFEKTVLNVRKMLVLTHKNIKLTLPESTSVGSSALSSNRSSSSSSSPSSSSKKDNHGHDQHPSSHKTPTKCKSKHSKGKDSSEIVVSTPAAAADLVSEAPTTTLTKTKKPFCMSAVFKPPGNTGPVMNHSNVEPVGSPVTSQIDFEGASQSAAATDASPRMQTSGSVILGSQFSQGSQPCSQVMDI